MKKYKTMILTMTALCLAACSSGEKQHEHDHEAEEHEGHEAHTGEIIMTAEQMEKAGVKTETATAADFTAVMKAAGQISRPQGDEQTIAATASGIIRLTSTSMTEGTAVGKGQTIATISSQNLQDGDPTAKAKAAYEAAKKEMERLKELVSDKIVSQREWEQAKMNYETARATYIGISAATHEGQTKVASSMNGFVKTLVVKTGDYVNVGDPIAIVTQDRMLQLVVDVPECAYKDMKHISGANFRTTGDDKVYRLADINGRLISYSRTLPEGAAYLPATFEMKNVGAFVPGSFVEVYLLMQSRKGVLTVPTTALTEEQGTHYIYIKENDAKHKDEGVFEKREVKIGQTDGVRTEITSGLEEGETVVAEGAYQVKLASAASVIPEGHNHNH
ncbi:MAG: efflux RND transporter periplasmic adaptor subunit [Prevotella sp.]